jgi:IclR family transcriptional regulator, acetate operon repressor
VSHTAQHETSDGSNRSVRRAVALLRLLAQEGEPVGVNEIARRSGLHKSTASRLLATLEREGMVEREAGAERYRLGGGLVRLAWRAERPGDLRAVARPALEALVEQARDTVHLAIRDGHEAVNIEQLDGPHLMREASWVGRRTPLHCVANGKALLAFAPPQLIDQVLRGTLPAFTSRTIVDARTLRGQLQSIRTRGYAVALGEIEEGLNAVAAPVLGPQGAVAAVSVSGPAYRVTPERIPELARLAVAAAEQIGAAVRP